MKPIDHSDTAGEGTNAKYEPRKDYRDYADKQQADKTSAERPVVKPLPDPPTSPQSW